ncbi:MAG: biotin--[acetyl-CoA-carboxylase] ligase [Marinilabiliaceae bacterium]|nr:biotin--[acetyl-CoA-carboxylase] ligase [Marinilabiliaceae bacterium]
MAHINDSPEFIILDETPSTNTELKNQLSSHKLREFSIVITEHQTAGRGQQGNSWESAKGANLTFSVLLRPSFLEPHLQFYLSKIVSLAIIDVLHTHHIEATIKWPNDIYINDEKVAGILIESSLTGTQMDSTIVGIGLNVNQCVFVSNAPNPISLKQVTGLKYDLENLLNQLLNAIIIRYHQLQENQFDDIDTLYFQKLYRNTGVYSYRDQNGTFVATLHKVNADGILTLLDQDGRKRQYAFKEVEFII